MADELPAGTDTTPPAADATPAPDSVPAVEPAAAPEPAPEPLDDDTEPGGNSPEAVFARKQRREAKRLREELEREREQRIRLDEQLKLKSEPPPEKKGYTKAELEAAVLAGNISAEDAEDILFAQRYAKVRQLEREAERQQKPLERAATEVQEFVKLEPALRDGNSEVRQRADDEMERLVNNYGYRRFLPGTTTPDPATQRQAIENVLGRIDALRTRKESERMTRANGRPAPTDVSAGGGGGAPRSTDPLAKVPKDIVDAWRSSGASEEQVKRYAEYHVTKLTRRQSRAGL